MHQSLPLARLVAFGTVSLFSLIVLGISAHTISWTQNIYGGYFSFTGLGVAVSLLTLLSLPAMIIIDATRVGVFTSYIVFELGWIGFLWIMWIATAGSTASLNVLGASCQLGFCSEFNAIEAFSFLNWIILLGYFLNILVFSIIDLQKGNKQVFITSVKHNSTLGSGKPIQSAATPVQYNMSSATPNQIPVGVAQV